MAFNYIPRDYPLPLTPKADQLLDQIDNFMGFAPFVGKDVHSRLTVYLDDIEVRTIVIPLEKLIEELLALVHEFCDLLNHTDIEDTLVSILISDIDDLVREIRKIEKLRKEAEDRDDYGAVIGYNEDLEGLIKRLVSLISDCIHCTPDLIIKIRKLAELIEECWETEKNHAKITQGLLGYYTRCGKSGGREIVLLMGAIGNDAELAARVYVHELMHAYFDDQTQTHPHCPGAEEPLAEYGMLCFMEQFVRANPNYTASLFDMAKNEVANKKHSFGVCHYGFGSYLFEDRANICVDWVSLYRNACIGLDIKSKEMQDYLKMISPIRYPRNKRECELGLLKALHMVSYSSLDVKIGVYARKGFEARMPRMTPSMITNLSSKSYCKVNIGINYPVLVDIRRGFYNERYYAKHYIIGGTTYRLCNDWREPYRAKLSIWFADNP